MPTERVAGEQRQRSRVGRVGAEREQVDAEVTQRVTEPEAVGQKLRDVLAVLEATADAGAKTVAKAACRGVGGLVIGELGRAEPAAGERALLREQQQDAGQHA